MPTRPYLVKHRITGEPRIVEAMSQAQAISHVASTTYSAEVASASDIVAYAVRRGIPVEKAGAATEQTPEPADEPADPDPAGRAPGEN